MNVEKRHMDDAEYRRRLIERVEASRQEARMSKPAFHQQIGPAASDSWTKFATASDEEAWHHFSLKAMSRIRFLFEVGVELLQFKS
jgi:hypothetical protein